MKNNGAIRKVMFIVLLSILGSYCIGSDHAENTSTSMFNSALQSTYSFVASVGSYCHKLWSEIMGKVMIEHKDKDVAIQKIPAEANFELQPLQEMFQTQDNSEHGNDTACTDDRADCMYNEHFFNTTWYEGKLDETTNLEHLDPDARPMIFIHDTDVEA